MTDQKPVDELADALYVLLTYQAEINRLTAMMSLGIVIAQGLSSAMSDEEIEEAKKIAEMRGELSNYQYDSDLQSHPDYKEGK
jgi:hypothetical protein